jgi:uncharacterized membrane protein (UPF0127 family)
MTHRSCFVVVCMVGSLFLSACTTSRLVAQRQQSIPIQVSQPSGEVVVVPTSPAICIKEQCFAVEIADDGIERMNGLMWREHMDARAWMWFVFDASAPHMAFRMKNTLIPLDMIWVDQSMQIVAIEHNVPPCKTQECPTYDPGSVPARYVLEINGGLANKYDFVIGDIVQLQE